MPKHTHMQAMPGWMAAYAPQRCEVCGRMIYPSGMEGMAQMGQNLFGSFLQTMSQMYEGMMGPWMSGMQSAWGMPGSGYSGKHQHRSAHHRHHHHRDCECGCDDDCGHDECHCRCCIGDVDLVVYARLGERRLVPITIENNRRREREIKLELSEWKTRGGQKSEVEVKSVLQTTQFTLGACEEKEVFFAVESNLVREVVGQKATVLDTESFEAAREAGEQEKRELPDLDECTVFSADLRVEGCDTRPIRIALALLPRDCNAYEIDCGCGCC